MHLRCPIKCYFFLRPRKDQCPSNWDILVFPNMESHSIDSNTVSASGCQVAGVSNWWVDLDVVDTDRGVIFQGATTDISGKYHCSVSIVFV